MDSCVRKRLQLIKSRYRDNPRIVHPLVWQVDDTLHGF